MKRVQKGRDRTPPQHLLLHTLMDEKLVIQPLRDIANEKIHDMFVGQSDMIRTPDPGYTVDLIATLDDKNEIDMARTFNPRYKLQVLYSTLGHPGVDFLANSERIDSPRKLIRMPGMHVSALASAHPMIENQLMQWYRESQLFLRLCAEWHTRGALSLPYKRVEQKQIIWMLLPFGQLLDRRIAPSGLHLCCPPVTRSKQVCLRVGVPAEARPVPVKQVSVAERLRNEQAERDREARDRIASAARALSGRGQRGRGGPMRCRGGGGPSHRGGVGGRGGGRNGGGWQPHRSGYTPYRRPT